MAKKLTTLFLLLIILMLSGCQISIENLLEPTQTTVATEPETTLPKTQPETTAPAQILPEGATLFGYDFGSLSLQQAKTMLQGILSGYRLTLTVNGEEFHLTGETMGLDFSEEVFTNWASGGSADDLLFFNERAVHSILEQQLAEPARNAAIGYNHTIERFIAISARTGLGIHTDETMDAIRQALVTLSPTASATARTHIRLPGITNSHSWIISAIDAANQYLDLELTYTYADRTETLTREQLAGLLSIDENFTVSVSQEAVRSFVSLIASRHGTDPKPGTLDGQAVTCYGSVIDQNAMYEHLLSCLRSMSSGSLTLPYLDAPDAPYGGNFVEVDLTAQMLTVWQDGKAAVTTPTVSGSVPNGDRTGCGNFTVYEKDTRCWLIGYDFRDYVNYWIAFNGNIGIHDASWRSDFGGSIYCYDGSHGCVNIPISMADAVYNNVSVGTRVIVHGGQAGSSPIQQVLSGTASYALTQACDPFRLDISPLHAGACITYETGDPRVVTVSSTGLVTVIDTGSTQITVRSAGQGLLLPAEFTVEIVVTGS